MRSAGTPLVLPLAACAEADVSQVGGKALGLGRLLAEKLNVPDGFVVTTDAYRLCTGTIAPEIGRVLSGAGDLAGDDDAANRIAELFAAEVLDDNVAAAIGDAYRALSGSDDAPVAVRSSATAEDAADASYAGQQDTYLWVRGAEDVIRKVVDCWASLFSARAIGYRRRQETAGTDLAMAVVIQRMVPAEAAGVMMTLEPIGGDRSLIYLESAYGLGEAVVAGEVTPDRFTIAKHDLSIQRQTIGSKDKAYRFDADAGDVQLVAVPESERQESSLSPDEIMRLGELGRRIETAFGTPMDIEWAVARNGDDDDRTLYLLQARPETVWSCRAPSPPTTQAARADVRWDSWDNLTSYSAPGVHWSTSNLGEAMPGVQTPLSWSIWETGVEAALREAAFAVGALTARERAIPTRPEDRFILPFFGRPALRVEFLAMVGDRMPGTTGPDAVRSLLGRVPDDLEFRPTRARYAAVAGRFPGTFASTPRRVRAMAADYEAWWRASVDRAESLDAAQAAAMLREAWDRHHRAVILQTVSVLGAIQPVHDLLARLVERNGAGDLSALTGVAGGAEIAIVQDLWRASRGQLELAEVVRRHGFHGPHEGEVSSVVWREDDAPLHAIAAQYAGRDDNENPIIADQARRTARPALERGVLAAVPPLQRPVLRAALAAARDVLPLRGVVKRSFLQALDVARASARQLGQELVDYGLLDERDDIFYLTARELVSRDGRPPDDARELVARRRERRADYQRLAIPPAWAGMPQVTAIDDAAPADRNDGDVVTGVGASGGVAEGTVRVLMTPDFGDAQPDEILVSPTTDPSWASIMFVSAALVVDVGGALSHAAVVAREIGIPCVVNTQDGTRRLRTGDRVRVDGDHGTVEILARG